MSQRRTKRQLQVYRDEPQTTTASSSQPSKRSRHTTDGQPSLTLAQPALDPVLADGISNLRDVSNLPNRAPRLVPGESLVSGLVDPEPGTSSVLAATTSEAHLLLALSIATQPQQRPNAVPSQLDQIAPQPRLIAARPYQPQLRPITRRPLQPQQRLITARLPQPQQRPIAPRSPQTQQQCIASRPSQPQPQLIAPQSQPHPIAFSSPTAPVATLQARPQTPPPMALVTALQADTPTREPSLSYAFSTSLTALPSTSNTSCGLLRLTAKQEG